MKTKPPPEPKPPPHERPVSLHPLTFDEALSGLLQVKPPEQKPTRRRKKKRRDS